MATRMDPKAAAQKIRGRMQQPSAEDRHIEAFVNQVLDELGMEHTIANAHMVVHALHDADIQPHQIVEYPKAVTVKVVNKKKYGDEDEHDETFTVQNEDEEHELREKHERPAAVQSEYPKTIQVRGTDGHMRPQVVRDLKEERELLGVGDSAIDPEASTQFKKSGLEPPTGEELDRAAVTSRGAGLEADALKKVNEAKAQPQQEQGAEETAGVEETRVDSPTPPKPPQRAIPRRA